MIWNFPCLYRVEMSSLKIQRRANASAKVKCMELPHLLCPQVHYDKLETPHLKENPQLGSTQKCLKDSHSPNLPSSHIFHQGTQWGHHDLLTLWPDPSWWNCGCPSMNENIIIRRIMKQQTELSWIAPWSKTHTGPSGTALVLLSTPTGAHSLASSSPNWITHSHLILIVIHSCIPRGVKAKASL